MNNFREQQQMQHIKGNLPSFPDSTSAVEGSCRSAGLLALIRRVHRAFPRILLVRHGGRQWHTIIVRYLIKTNNILQNFEEKKTLREKTSYAEQTFHKMTALDHPLQLETTDPHGGVLRFLSETLRNENAAATSQR